MAHKRNQKKSTRIDEENKNRTTGIFFENCAWLYRFIWNGRKQTWYESNSKEEMILWHSMDSTWVGDSLGTYIRIGSRFYVSRTHQDLHQTPNSYGGAIFCQLNRTN